MGWVRRPAKLAQSSPATEELSEGVLGPMGLKWGFSDSTHIGFRSKDCQ